MLTWGWMKAMWMFWGGMGKSKERRKEKILRNSIREIASHGHHKVIGSTTVPDGTISRCLSRSAESVYNSSVDTVLSPLQMSQSRCSTTMVKCERFERYSILAITCTFKIVFKNMEHDSKMSYRHLRVKAKHFSTFVHRFRSIIKHFWSNSFGAFVLVSLIWCFNISLYVYEEKGSVYINRVPLINWFCFTSFRGRKLSTRWVLGVDVIDYRRL